MNRPTFPNTGDERPVVSLTDRDVRDAARLLSRIVGVDVPDWVEEPADANLSNAVLVNRARQILSHRRARLRTFGAEMFGETAWDVLLVLYAERGRQRLSVSRLTEQAGAAPTTVLRWLKYLESRDWISREVHRTDRRIVFAEITEKGQRALDSYLSETLAKDK